VFTKAFLLALLERAIKTFCQSLVAVLIASPVLNLFEVNWWDAVGVAGLTTLLSVLTTIGSGVITSGNASLAKGSEVTTPPNAVVLDADGGMVSDTDGGEIDEDPDADGAVVR
jgi:hypothetical protein